MKLRKRDYDTPTQDTLASLCDFFGGVFRHTSQKGIIYANATFLIMFGYKSVSELDEESSLRLFADLEEYEMLIDKINAEGQIINQRVLFRTNDHRFFWGNMTCRRVEKAGCVYYDGVITDIQDFVRKEAELREKATALEKSTMELDRFIYSASHDIRAPITSILGVLNLIKIDPDHEHLTDYIQMVDVSARKLNELVKELTDYARNSRQVTEDVYIDFRALLKEVVEVHRNEHPLFSKVRIKTQVRGDYYHYSDQYRLKLILNNIIRNSLDFLDSGKSVPMISVQIELKPGSVEIEVIDNGIGIPAGHVERVFDMFYRATMSSKGAGLGLYITREAVIKLGGTIDLHSAYGVGTSIHVQLPNSTKGKLVNRKRDLRRS